ncbi:MAG: outer membrane beta-barrel protein, partial [Alphaproteobacteria bacterium]
MKAYVFALLALPALAVAAEEAALEFSVKLGSYQYTENPNFMSLDSLPAYGLGGAYTIPLDAHQRLRFEGTYTQAKADYKSSQGATKDNSNRYIDLRAFYARHFDYGSMDITPRVGLGYRFLRNVLADIPSVATGYARESTYLYLPVGVEVRTPTGFYADAEYGYLLKGRQVSALSPDLENEQDTGSHIRLSAGYETDIYKIGPYVDFWRIEQSSTDCAGSTCGYEPKNFTREFGVQLTLKIDTLWHGMGTPARNHQPLAISQPYTVVPRGDYPYL